MVVRAHSGKNLSISARPYVAVVLGGLAGIGNEENTKIEQFLRSAEPPAHDMWTHDTRAVKDNYKCHGIKKKFKDFDTEVVKEFFEAFVLHAGIMSSAGHI